MKLINVKIENFKSIQSLELKISGNLYCLVGKNETGKSNIFKAIQLIGNNTGINLDDLKLNKALSNSTITGTFELHPLEVNKMRGISTTINVLKGGYNSNALQGIQVVVTNNARNRWLNLVMSDGKVFKFDDTSYESQQQKTAMFEFFNARIPRIEYFEKEDFLIQPLDLNDLSITSDNSQSFTRLLALGGITDLGIFSDPDVEEVIKIKETAAKKINEYLDKYYKSTYNLQVRLDSHNNKLTLHFIDEYKNLTSLSERSTGVQYFFSFLVNKLYLQNFYNQQAIYLLDEPGLSLHPTSQKAFGKLLQELSEGNQILYTTHSPFLINRMSPTNVWTIERDVIKGTVINPKPYQHNWRSLRSSLGIDFADSFFYGDKSLLVEGPEDKIYILSLIRLLSKTRDLSLNSDLLSIIDSGGVSNMPAMVQILREEERPLLVFLDSDDVGIFNRLKRKQAEVNSKDLMNVLTVSDISKDAMTIEDLLPETLYIQSARRYIEDLILDGIIEPKEQEAEVGELFVGKSKRYTDVAEYILQYYKSTDERALNTKTPVSKVGIAHTFDKLLFDEFQSITEAEMSLCQTFIQKILATLKLI